MLKQINSMEDLNELPTIGEENDRRHTCRTCSSSDNVHSADNDIPGAFSIIDDFKSTEKELQKLLLKEYPKGYEDAMKEFESRTCGSCIVMNCEILNAIVNTGTIRIVDFGCNKWESKD